MKISKRNLLWLIVLTVFGPILMGCAMGRKSDTFPVQGDNEYGINFELDYDVFDEGEYFYAPFDRYSDSPLRMGGGRSGYRRYYTLIMNFSFKDGRSFHEEIDIEALMRDLADRENIYDVRGLLGSGATVEINISKHDLIIVYVISEVFFKPNYKIKDYRYPLYRKELN